jgi:hypothetical protein
MALEAAVLYRAAAGLFGRCLMAGAGGGAWHSLFGGGEGMLGLDGGDWDAAAASSSMQPPHGWFQELDISAATSVAPQGNQPGGHAEMSAGGVGQADAAPVTTAPTGRRKRRRTRTAKNSEEVESQRMTHIAVERNRRKMMNEYLASLRSLMPPSYAQRVTYTSRPHHCLLRSTIVLLKCTRCCCLHRANRRPSLQARSTSSSSWSSVSNPLRRTS